MIQTTHLKSYFLLSVGRKILTSRLKAHRAIQFHWIDLFVFERPLLSLNSDFTWFIQSNCQLCCSVSEGNEEVIFVIYKKQLFTKQLFFLLFTCVFICFVLSVFNGIDGRPSPLQLVRIWRPGPPYLHHERKPHLFCVGKCVFLCLFLFIYLFIYFFLFIYLFLYIYFFILFYFYFYFIFILFLFIFIYKKKKILCIQVYLAIS